MGRPSEKKELVVKGNKTNGTTAHVSKGKNERKQPVIKQEPEDTVMGEAMPSGSESDVPLAKRMPANRKKKGAVNGQSSTSKQVSVKAEDESSESDSQMRPIRRRPKRILVSESEGSGDDVPLAQKMAKSTGSNKNKLPSVPVKEEKVDNKRKRMDSESEGDDKNIIAKSDPKRSSKKVSPKKEPNEVVRREGAETSSRETVPIAKRVGKTNGKKMAVVKDESQDSDSDVPLAVRMANKNKTAANKAVHSKEKVATKSPSAKAASVKQEVKTPVKGNKPQVKRKRSDSDSEFDDKKQVAKAKSSTKSSGSSKKTEPERKKKKGAKSPGVDDEMSEKKRGKQKAKPDAVDERDDEEEDDEFKWWSQQNAEDDGSVKWTTLEHNGVYFPPPYVPHNVKMKYDGKEITLSPEAEEVASFYAAMINTDYGQNQTFIENFFKDWKKVLAKSSMNPKIDNISKCDFNPIFEHFEREKELKKGMTKDEKARLKEEKLRLEEKYGYCILDGRREKVGNFRIEPPGLFRGRGAHPKCGKLKQRVLPEQVTINIGKDAPVPKPPEGHHWKEVIHDNTVTWLATWKENINSNIKYVFLAANSSLKGQSDLQKFEKARELKKHIDRIRKDYQRDLKEKLTAKRQMATVIYLIDRLALRAGNEKDTKHEADTVGCCSLRVEHITLTPPKTVKFDFLGKDSIRYENTVEVEETVFKNLKIFMKGKDPQKHFLFDRVTTTDLNKHLSEYMKGLTAKVFRTYNASYTFQEQLDVQTDPNSTIAEKILAYNRANRKVAVLCNHQRSVSKAHVNQMSKITDKLRSLKYQRMKAKKALLSLDPRLKKKRPDLAEPESDLEDDWIIEYEKQLMEKEREKVRKKFEKDNETRKEEKKKLLTEKDLEAMLKEVDERQKELERERKTGKIELKKNHTVEKLDAQIEKLTGRITETNVAIVDKEENKQTALSTSKINYIDPRISAAWCLKHKVPTEKIFNRSLRDKFKWALDVVDADWEF